MTTIGMRSEEDMILHARVYEVIGLALLDVIILTEKYRIVCCSFELAI